MTHKSVSLIAATAVLVVFGGARAPGQQAQCKLLAEPSEHVQGCMVITGYSGGRKVGAFQIAEGFDRKEVGTTDACLLGGRYHRELGRIVGDNRVEIGGKTFELSPDCRDSTLK